MDITLKHTSNTASSALTYATKAQATADTKCAMATASVVLSSSGWENLSQTVDCEGVTVENAVIVAPAADSHTTYYENNVRCTAQAEGQLTFACDYVPDMNLTVNVLILT